jgi:23S rRNA pseudouridine2605 synthase
MYIICFINPKGYITSVKDDKGRKTVMELINDKQHRIFPIGRLDYETEGLLLFTNDGDIAQKLMHPSKEIDKTYVANIKGELSENDLMPIRNGMIIDGVKTPKCVVKLIGCRDGVSRINITIHEGKNREIRKMFERIHKEVLFLKRVSIGEIRLGGLSRGQYRPLNEKEMDYLSRL